MVSPLAAFHAAFADVEGATFEVTNSFLNPVTVIRVLSAEHPRRYVEARLSDYDVRVGGQARVDESARLAREKWDELA